MIKNRAVTGFSFLLLNTTTGAPVTTGTPTGYYTIDGGAQNVLTGSITHIGNGQWTIDVITAAQMNGDVIVLLFTEPSSISVLYTISTTGIAAGVGAITWTYTVTILGTTTPIADVDVWITTDSGGVNIIASGKTNQSGVVTFYLDAGTVYVWRQKSGYNFTNPDTEVVS